LTGQPCHHPAIDRRPEEGFTVPHLPLSRNLPGLSGILAFKPATARPIVALVEELLRGTGPLTLAERELIAAHTSQLNDCEFCARTHAAAASRMDGIAGPDEEPPSPRLAALLALAEATVHGGHHVTDELVGTARAAGLVDEEIHDTVLIAAAFCMINRYVDGLGAETPAFSGAYDLIGEFTARKGYLGLAPG
jgi:uncharacterized peroxidase-related enzyme